MSIKKINSSSQQPAHRLPDSGEVALPDDSGDGASFSAAGADATDALLDSTAAESLSRQATQANLVSYRTHRDPSGAGRQLWACIDPSTRQVLELLVVRVPGRGASTKAVCWGPVHGATALRTLVSPSGWQPVARSSHISEWHRTIDSPCWLEFEPTLKEIAADFEHGFIDTLRSSSAAIATTLEGHSYLRAAAARQARTPVSDTGMYFMSPKMGVLVIFDSTTLKMPATASLESDNDVIGYFDRPPNLHVRYEGIPKRYYLHTPDYLVIRRAESVLVECSLLSQILRRNSTDPGFYFHDGNGWVCPSLQDAASRLGMRHEVWTEESLPGANLRSLPIDVDRIAAGALKGPI